jgi:hypothetical protein
MVKLLARSVGRIDTLLNIGSEPGKQGKFPAKGRKNNAFAVLDLALARIVNGADCQRFRSFFHRDICPGNLGP